MPQIWRHRAFRILAGVWTPAKKERRSSVELELERAMRAVGLELDRTVKRICRTTYCHIEGRHSPFIGLDWNNRGSPDFMYRFYNDNAMLNMNEVFEEFIAKKGPETTDPLGKLMLFLLWNYL